MLAFAKPVVAHQASLMAVDASASGVDGSTSAAVDASALGTVDTSCLLSTAMAEAHSHQICRGWLMIADQHSIPSSQGIFQR